MTGTLHAQEQCVNVDLGPPEKCEQYERIKLFNIIPCIAVFCCNTCPDSHVRLQPIYSNPKIGLRMSIQLQHCCNINMSASIMTVAVLQLTSNSALPSSRRSTCVPPPSSEQSPLACCRLLHTPNMRGRFNVRNSQGTMSACHGFALVLQLSHNQKV